MSRCVDDLTKEWKNVLLNIMILFIYLSIDWNGNRLRCVLSILIKITF